MANDTMLTDDFVAEIIAREAKDASMKYSTMGLEAFRSSKPANKAKPNTRFLRNIIRETKNHNEALLAKEAVESQARLSDLEASEEKKRKKLRPSADDMRRRQLGDITSILSGRKRKRDGNEDVNSAEKGTSRHDAGAGRSSQRVSRSRREHGGDEDDMKNDRDRHKHHRKRDRDEGRDAERRHRHRSRSRSRSPSPSRSPSQSPRHRHRRHRHRSPLTEDEDQDGPRPHRSPRRKDDGGTPSEGDLIGRALSKRIRRGRLAQPDDPRDLPGTGGDRLDRASSRRSRQSHPEMHEEEDSDPLDDFIGPAPPPEFRVRGRARGRGANSSSSAMDMRFSNSYDPRSDAQPELEDADSDEAIEAFRDRMKWKQQGADRLRAAGFTNEQIRKWEKGGEKDIQDVRWVGAGQSREWDRGKSLGEIETPSATARWQK